MLITGLKKLIFRSYSPLNRIEISKKRLIDNYVYLSSLNSKIKVAPVLKSNAYSHGIVETAKIIDPFQPPFFCVDSIYEAYALYQAKIKSDILVMGYVDPKNLMFKKLPFSFAAYDEIHFQGIVKAQPQASIHLFVDTGMNREGIAINNLNSFLDKIAKSGFRNINGLMSHFAASDKPNDERTVSQMKNFERSVEILSLRGIYPKWKHIANSTALLNNRLLGLDKTTNLARTGMAFYGVDPSGNNRNLKRALRFITHIVQIKKVASGSAVGYDFTYKAKKDILSAVLPVGYNDGVDRGLSNKGFVRIKNKLCPIIGRVSMNLTTVDVSGLKQVFVGDEAEILFLGPLKTRISYELFVNLNKEVKRIIV